MSVRADCIRNLRTRKCSRRDGSCLNEITSITLSPKSQVSKNSCFYLLNTVRYNSDLCGDVEDKNFNLIILLDAHIRLLDFEALSKR